VYDSLGGNWSLDFTSCIIGSLAEVRLLNLLQ